MRLGLPAVRKPPCHDLRGPCRRAIGVARRAGVRCADRHRQVGPRDADGVIPPRIDHHVGLGGHVAVDTLGAGAAGLVVDMGRHVELRRQMALGAQRVALGAQLQAVRLVAVGAGDTCGVHAALQERAIFEDLAVDLSVRVIEARLQIRGEIGIEKRRARHGMPGDHLAAGMAGGAGVELHRQERLRPVRDARLGVHLPPTVVAGPELHHQALLVRVLGSGRIGPCPGDMARAGAVAGLAGHVHVGPGRGVAVGGQIIVFLQARRVAVGAHVVPGLVAPGPVQPVARSQCLIGIEVEPALAAPILGPAVPGDAERLQPAAGERDQILLKGIDAEGVSGSRSRRACRPARRC